MNSDVAAIIVALIGVGLSAVYIAVAIHIWRKRSHLWALIGVLNAAVFVYPTAEYIYHIVQQDAAEPASVHWTLLLFILPATLVYLFVTWNIRDNARANVIASTANERAGRVRDATDLADERRDQRDEVRNQADQARAASDIARGESDLTRAKSDVVRDQADRERESDS